MKTRSEVICCKRCGDAVSHQEKMLTGGELCAFCDQMRGEALHIHQAVSRNNQGKFRLRLV